MDGFFAAAVVQYAYRDEEVVFYAADYGDPVPDIPANERVIIVDFSFSRNELLAISKQRPVLVIDHHKTAAEDIKDLPFVRYDAGECGASLAWRVLMESDSVPEVIRYVRDRDLWEWKLDDSRAVSLGLRMAVASPLDAFEFFVEPKLLREARAMGNAAKLYQEILVDQLCEKMHLIEIGGYTVPAVNTPVLISEVGERLADKYPFVACYFDTDNDKRVYSLRSTPDGVDVGELARSRGGGGHRNSAGFRVDIHTAQLLQSMVTETLNGG